MDSDFFDLASQVPGFGGMVRDAHEGATIFLVDPTRMHAAETAAHNYANGLQRPIKGPIRFVPALFDWRQLFIWRRSIDELLVHPGVVLTDIDESRNRIVVGIVEETARQIVLRELERRQIPAVAVEFTIAGSSLPDALLTDRVRPVAAGLQIERSGASPCTFGFIGLSNSYYFATTSHCTSDTGLADGEVWGVHFYQNRAPYASNFVGTEQIDPPFFTGGYCPAGVLCRWSDSALISLGTTEFSPGRIKRTTQLGSKTIAGDFRIVEERAYPDLGMTVHKVGRSTGWTTGEVQETCVNTDIGDGSAATMFLCQDIANYARMGGDSGAPVFRILSGNDVQLIGMHWGVDLKTGQARMSAMVNIEYETIQLNTCDPEIPSYYCT
jgi:hypothetical protein